MAFFQKQNQTFLDKILKQYTVKHQKEQKMTLLLFCVLFKNNI